MSYDGSSVNGSLLCGKTLLKNQISINMSNEVLASTSLPCLLINKDKNLSQANWSLSQPLIGTSESIVNSRSAFTPPLNNVCDSKNCSTCSVCSSGSSALGEALLPNGCSHYNTEGMDKAHYLCSHRGPQILAKGGDGKLCDNLDVPLLSRPVPVASMESLNSVLLHQSSELSLIVTLSENQGSVASANSTRHGTKLSESSSKLTDSMALMCRICHSGEEEEELITACRCAGTVKFAHQSCLLNWISKSGNQSCELCRYKFRTRRRKIRYFWKWQFPEVSTKGYLHIGLFIAFTTMLLTSVIWIIWSRASGTPSAVSERTTEEVKFAYMLNGLFIALALGGLYFDSLRHMKRYFKRWSVLNQHVIIERYIIENDKTHKQHLKRDISGISVGIEATETDGACTVRNGEDADGTWV